MDLQTDVQISAKNPIGASIKSESRSDSAGAAFLCSCLQEFRIGFPGKKNVKNLSLLIFLILHAVIMKTFMGHYIVEPRAIHLICVMRGRFHIFCAAASETDAPCHTRLHNLVGMWISKRLFGFYIGRPITISGLWALDRD